MQKEEREQELAYFDQTEQKIKEQVKALPDRDRGGK